MNRDEFKYKQEPLIKEGVDLGYPNSKEYVNKEIEDFLASKLPQQTTVNQGYKYGIDDVSSNFRYLLESIHQVYTEINNNLKSNNLGGIQDTILKNDIKTALLNEGLLNSLKEAVIEKERLDSENSKMRGDTKVMSEQISKLRMLIERGEQDEMFRRSKTEELDRVVRDQKEKIQEIQHYNNKLKTEIGQLKNKYTDLENLRLRSSERFSSYQKEMDVLNQLLGEKEEIIKKLNENNRVESDKNSHIKIRIGELERQCEIMNQKIISKDTSISLCNEEMSKIIVANKRLESENQKYKSTGLYYENLYKNLNSQNSYLNSQLNKMIRCETFSKDGGLKIMEDFEEKEKLYKKKIRKLKSVNEELIEENEKIKEKLEDQLYHINPADDTKILNGKIEDLIKLNKEYKTKVSELEDKIKERNTQEINSFKKPQSLFSNNEQINKELSPIDIFSNKIKNDKYEFKQSSPFMWQYNPKPATLPNLFPSVPFNSRTGLTAPSYGQKIQPTTNTVPLQQNYKTYFDQQKLKQLNLSRNYDEEKNDSVKLPGGIGNLSEITWTSYEDEKNDATNIKMDDELVKRMADLNTKVINNNNISSKPIKAKKTRGRPKKKPSAQLYRDKEDNSVEDDSQPISSTATLKEMIRKTENLKKKFENIDDEIGKVDYKVNNGRKEIDNDNLSRLKSQIQAYNNFYSDVNLDDNDDIL